MNHFPDECWVYRETAGDLRLGELPRFVQHANLANRFVCQLRIRTAFAARHAFRALTRPVVIATRSAFWMYLRPVAALLRAVAVVVAQSTNEQVCGVNAGAVVAAMEYAEVCWDGTICNLIRQSMDVEISASAGFVIADSDNAVTVRHSLTAPNPAVIGTATIDATPEAFSDRLSAIGHLDILLAIEG